jgi:hypothetical protein
MNRHRGYDAFVWDPRLLIRKLWLVLGFVIAAPVGIVALWGPPPSPSGVDAARDLVGRRSYISA